MSVDLIFEHFDNLSETQKEQFSQLQDVYEKWNAQINVISRKDTENFYERHVLHSLGIAKVASFVKGTKILDIGTGGGFPGIPLAILFPECQFHLVDSIGKKIKVVNEVAKEIGLQNITSEHQRAEKVKEQYDFIVSRAVTRMNRFMPWTRGKFLSENKNELHNGILYLKGGDIHEELSEVRVKHYPTVHDLKDYFGSEFFETKKVVYYRMK